MIKDYTIKEEFFESKLQEILDSINTGNTKATYTSGCGLSHETYLEKLKEDFEYWIYETYAIFDEDGEYYEDAEDFEYSLHDVIAKFIEELDLTFYLKLIERNIYSRIQ